MATSTLPVRLAGNLLGTSEVSFSTVLPGYGGNALNNLNTDIATYSSGVVLLTSSGGPVFHAVLGKYTNEYYSGLLFYYASNVLYAFRRNGSVYSVYRIS